MNHFMLPSDQRMSTWIHFREELKKLDEIAQMDSVVGFWAMCPFGKWALEIDEPKWPTIWEVITGGDYCKNTIAYGMAETLRLAGWDARRFNLVMIKSRDDGEEFFTLIIDGDHVLNYAYNELASINDLQEETRLFSYAWNGRQYVKVS